MEETGWNSSDQEPIRCANGCGFFGNPVNFNFCSKCYRDFCLRRPQSSSVTTSEAVELHEPLQSVSIACSSSSGGSVDVNPAASGTIEPSVVVKNRCLSCNKKVGLLGFHCRCGNTFCPKHRYPEMHECDFDYRVEGKEAIAKANPSVKPEKIQRF